MIENGNSLPDFSLKSHDGEEYTNAGLQGQWVVLHTFPLAFTGGWSSQTTTFNRALKQFENKDAKVLGLSVDSTFALKTWAAAMGGIRHPLLSDFWPHGAVAQSLGIFNDVVGIASRTVLIADPDGVVRHTEVHSKTLPDPEQLLATLADLQK